MDFRTLLCPFFFHKWISERCFVQHVKKKWASERWLAQFFFNEGLPNVALPIFLFHNGIPNVTLPIILKIKNDEIIISSIPHK